jgi:AcrR family transcriptional regulator
MAKKSELTRERIFEAAISCFENFGYKKTSIDEIAQSAGVGRGTVYIYFKDKDDLFLEILKYKTADLLEAATVGVCEANDAIGGLVRLAHNIINSLEKDPLLFNSFRNAREVGISHLMPQLNELVGSGIALKEKVILNGIDKGDINPVNARAVAFVLNMGFESFYLTRKSEGLGISSDEYLEFWERLLREGIAAGAADRNNRE